MKKVLKYLISLVIGINVIILLLYLFIPDMTPAFAKFLMAFVSIAVIVVVAIKFRD